MLILSVILSIEIGNNIFSNKYLEDTVGVCSDVEGKEIAAFSPIINCYKIRSNTSIVQPTPQPTTTTEPTPTPQPTTVQPSSHPNIFLNSYEIDTIKNQIGSESQSRQGAYDNFINRDLSFALNTANNPPSVTYGGPTPPSGNNHDYYEYQGSDETRYDYSAAIAVGRAVRTLGLAYALTNDQTKKDEYAEKAIKIIKVWTVDDATKMNPKFQGCNNFFDQSWIDLSITMPGMFYGTDLIWDSPKWNNYPGVKDKFKTWISDLIQSARTCTKFASTTGTVNNLGNWRLLFIASASALIDDTTNLQYAFDTFKRLIPLQIDAQGKIKNELDRPTSLSYSLYAINAMIQTAEIARHRGVDLYNYKLPDGRGLEKALDTHAQYAANPSSWPHRQDRAYDGANTALYELAYKYKQKSVYMSAINRWGRPMYEIRTMGPVTLTHS